MTTALAEVSPIPGPFIVIVQEKAPAQTFALTQTLSHSTHKGGNISSFVQLGMHLIETLDRIGHGEEAMHLLTDLLQRREAPSQAAAAMPRVVHEFLSVRQLAVLQLIGQGRSNKQIARVLNLAPETVKSYVKHIFMKLGTQTRAQSVAYAAKRGLL